NLVSRDAEISGASFGEFQNALDIGSKCPSAPGSWISANGHQQSLTDVDGCQLRAICPPYGETVRKACRLIAVVEFYHEFVPLICGFDDGRGIELGHFATN